jgi:hypothetical protein
MSQSIDNVVFRLTKKHPVNYGITASESNHCVLGYTIYGFVELEEEKIMYATDKAGRLRVVNREALNPTYKSIRKEVHTSAVVIDGGKYDCHYIVGTQGDGWLKTSTNVADVQPMRPSYATDFRNYVAFHAQHCYRGSFKVVSIVNH